MRLDLADRIGLTIDAGRQINPVLHASTEALDGLIEIATMLAHRRPRHANASATSNPPRSSIARM